jgi:hypothetical protein
MVVVAVAAAAEMVVVMAAATAEAATTIKFGRPRGSNIFMSSFLSEYCFCGGRSSMELG